jgi:hypothetical protein
VSIVERNTVPIYVGREFKKLVNMVAAAREVRPNVVVEEALRAAYGEPGGHGEGAVPCACERNKSDEQA